MDALGAGAGLLFASCTAGAAGKVLCQYFGTYKVGYTFDIKITGTNHAHLQNDGRAGRGKRVSTASWGHALPLLDDSGRLARQARGQVGAPTSLRRRQFCPALTPCTKYSMLCRRWRRLGILRVKSRVVINAFSE